MAVFGAFASMIKFFPAGESPAPLSTPAACINSHDVGGDLILNVNDLFDMSIVNLTGVGVPGAK